MKSILSFSLILSIFVLSNPALSQTEVSGVISENTTWTKANSPYFISNNVLVSLGTKLTIEPGVIIKVNSSKYLKIEGEIYAVGTLSDSIKFESNEQVPTRGAWDKIWLKGTNSSFTENYEYLSGSIFQYCIFNSALEGLKIDDAIIQIKNSTFTGNRFGINFKKTSNSLIYRSIFRNNLEGTSTSAGTEDNGVGSFTNCFIVENIFQDNSNSGFNFGGYRNNSNNNLIKKNLVINNGGVGLNFQWGDVVTGFSDNIIEENIVFQNKSHGIVICRDRNILRKNIIAENHGDGIAISGTYIYTGLTIENNIFFKNERRAVDLSSNNNTSFRFNQVIKSGKKDQYAAIELPSAYISATNNIITNNSISYSNFIDLKVHYGPNIVTNNNFFGIKEDFFIKITNKANFSIDATNNYWAGLGGIDISNRLFDKNDDFELGLVNIDSPIQSPLISAPISLPRNVSRLVQNGELVVAWNGTPISDLAGYKIYFGDYTGYSFSNVIDVGNVTSFVLPAGISIDEPIAVTAYDVDADGVDDQFDGNESWFSLANKIPDAPSDLQGSVASKISIINWTTNHTNLNSNFYVYRSNDNVNFSRIGITRDSNFRDEDLIDFTKYYYKITAFDSLDLSYDNFGLESQFSPVIELTPVDKPLLKLDSTFHQLIKISWELENKAGVLNYEILRGSSEQDFELLTRIDSVNQFLYDTVPNGNKFFYKVKGLNKDGIQTKESNVVSAVSFQVSEINTPLNNQTKAALKPEITWRSIEFADNYHLQLSLDPTFQSDLISDSIGNFLTFTPITSLYYNENYYLRVRNGDSKGWSNWSNTFQFQTKLEQPTISIDSTFNRVIELSWNLSNTNGIKNYKVFRGTNESDFELLYTLDSTKNAVKDSVSNGKKYFYKIVSLNNNDIESDDSNIVSAVAFAPSLINTPIKNEKKVTLNKEISWDQMQYVERYQIQLSIDSTFSLISEFDSIVSITKLTPINLLEQNQDYFLRIRNGDSNGWSNWSDITNFQTQINPATLISVEPANKKINLEWSINKPEKIKKIEIHRSVDEGDFEILVDLSSDLNFYLDSGLNLQTNYKYKIKTYNKENVASEFSSIKEAVPFNSLPKVVELESFEFPNIGEFNTVRVVYSANGSVDIDGEIVKYEWYVNDSLLNITDPLFIHFYSHGTTDVKLVITDDDGGKDSVSTHVSVSAFKKRLNGGIFGGLTAVNRDRIYAADSYLDPNNGAKVQIINREGVSQFDLVVGNRIFTTPSVTSDSSVFITSGTNLNGFNKGGAPLWATLPLGGNSRVTPSIDEISNRIYLGVSNSNFFAIDYLTGKVIWNVICDAPIESSAVITSDRKLVFITKIGTMYGFDISTGVAHTVPGWKVNFGEVSLKSVAIDDTNHIIFGTDKGNLYKVKLEENGTITTLWKVPVSTSINSAPVIDSQGFIYIGNEEGILSKINPSDGAILWKFNAIAPIRSTPAISNFESINFATQIGTVFSLDNNGKLRWKYNANSPISANILYIDNMLYLGTEEGDLIALYDNPISNTTSPNARISNQLTNTTPVWATFQGDFRRTGTKKDLSAPLVQAKDYTAKLQENGSVLVAAAQIDNGSTDNVGITEMTLSKSTFTCTDLGENKITFTAKDASGNTTSAEVTVTVVDEIKPTLKAKSSFTIKLDAEGKATLKWEDIDEGSTDNCSIKDRILSKAEFTCTDLGENKITFTAKDASGNTTSAEVTVTVVDEIKPTLKAKSSFTIKLDAEGKATLKWEDIDEGSTDNCSIKDRILSKAEFTRDDNGEQTITYTVKDASGNEATVEIKVRVDVILSTPTIHLEKQADIKLYPNPAKNSLSLEFEKTINPDEIVIEIVDATGRSMGVINAVDYAGKSLRIDTSGLSNGIHFIKISSEKSLKVLKFIINR